MIEIPQNMSETDRIIRGVVGIWLVVIAVGALVDGRRTTAATTAIAGIGLLANAQSGFCGGNALFGIDASPEASCLIE